MNESANIGDSINVPMPAPKSSLCYRDEDYDREKDSPSMTTDEIAIYLKLVALVIAGKIEWRSDWDYGVSGRYLNYSIEIRENRVEVSISELPDGPNKEGRFFTFANFTYPKHQLAGDLYKIARSQVNAIKAKHAAAFLGEFLGV